MGLADRFLNFGRADEPDLPTIDLDDRSAAIQGALTAMLAPFIPDDGMGKMLGGLATRFLGDAGPAELQQVVDQLCAAADDLAPFRTEAQNA